MASYRTTDMGKVRECYENLTSDEKSSLSSNSLTITQASSIEQKLQRHDLSLSVHCEELRRCIFDGKTESRLEERIESERKKKSEDTDRFGICFTKQGDVHGNVTVIAGLSIAKHVDGSQFAVLGAAINYAQHVDGSQLSQFGVVINYAQHVGDQWAGFGAINYAQNVGGDQVAGIGAINYAGEVMGSQFALTGCAINVAKRVGKNQAGLLNIVTEIIKGKQIGLFNYAKKLGKGAKQFGLVNLEAKHSDKTKKRWISGPQRWWNPEISFFYRKAEEQDETIEDIATKDSIPTQARIKLDEKEPKVRVTMDELEEEFEEAEVDAKGLKAKR